MVPPSCRSACQIPWESKYGWGISLPTGPRPISFTWTDWKVPSPSNVRQTNRRTRIPSCQDLPNTNDGWLHMHKTSNSSTWMWTVRNGNYKRQSVVRKPNSNRSDARFSALIVCAEPVHHILTSSGQAARTTCWNAIYLNSIIQNDQNLQSQVRNLRYVENEWKRSTVFKRKLNHVPMLVEEKHERHECCN